MRAIQRQATAPPTLDDDEAGGKQTALNRDARTADPPAALKFPDHWNEPDVRGVLYATQWRVCAYCARLLPGNDRGDVEHFRPKRSVRGDRQHEGYWWIAYKLSNYVLSCGVCNSSRKGNKFPLRPRASRVTYNSRHRLPREARLLLDPTVDPIEAWLTVNIDDSLVPVIPQPQLSRTQRLQIESTIDFFRINRDRFLIRERLTVLDHVTSALTAGDDQRAKAMAVRFSPQSIVARTVLEQIDPTLLPSPTEELDWLLDRVLGELDELLEVLERYPDDDRSKKELDETFWCLAALLKAPLDGDPQRLEKVFCEHGVLDQIQPLAMQL